MDARLFEQTLLHRLCDGLIRLEGCSLREPQINQYLGPGGIWEKLLLHAAHAHNAQSKQQHRDTNGLPAVLHTPRHRATEIVVKRAVKQLMRAALCARGFGLEQQSAQIRHKVNRHPPAQHQGDHGDRKNSKGVFTHSGLGHANWQETRGGDQRAGQHRHRRDFISKGRSTYAVVALFHFAHHHLHRNDGVVHQQAQGDDERAERDFVQPDAPVVHGQKRHGQHQRNRDRHHQTGANVHIPTVSPALVQAQRDKADHQHNQHRLNQHTHKLTHRLGHRLRLVLHLLKGDTDRQCFFDTSRCSF